MQNLLNFLWKYRNFLFFIFLEVLALFFLVQSNNFHHSKFVHTVNTVSGNFYLLFHDVKQYFYLKKQNEDLAKENARLKKLELNSQLRIYTPTKFVEDTLYGIQYEYISAKIIHNTVHLRNNYLLTDQGSDQDIEPGMGVISAKGVVGIIKDVSPHFSNAISVLHSKTKISAKIKKNNYFGLITWNGKNPRVVQLNDIPLHVDISIGDTVVTRGSSAIFPPEILIGTIQSYEKNEVEGFYNIDVLLSVDFKNVTYVQIVKNLYKKEMKELIEKMQEESD
ncbi:MAG: rod shape-determining protein MreC [Bacteroidetes bacterium]|nr:MAG: rod shape-determining protein MreC [Bacteroidota bacterium]